jgi:hypothetical protein
MRKIKYAVLALVFLSSLSLADDAPPADTQKKMTLQDLINNAAGSSDNSTSVAGVRGLEETSGAVDTQARDFAALERLEHVVVHDDELAKFIEEGKLR